MPLPVVPDAIKVTLKANLIQGSVPVEQAQFGFTGVRVHNSGNPTNWGDDVQELAEKVRDKWIEHIIETGFWSQAVVMESVRVDHLTAATGRTADVGIAPFGPGKEWHGVEAQSLPWETTLCVSLYGYDEGEFVLNKARKRGRMYLPPPSQYAITDTTGQVGSVILDQLTDSIVDFFNDVQGAEMGDATPPNDPDYFDLRILSKGTKLKPLEPTSTPVTRIRIDSRIDSQRRRERQQPPLRSASGVVEHAS